jgi:pimeloyl-ACP methyl ester carboxylesterase
MSDSSTTVRLPGAVLTEHRFPVPLDHARPDGDQITVFAREVAAPDGGDRPYLVFLQGGPGGESPRPVPATGQPGWLGRALRDHRVLLLDQRGTGLSTAVPSPGDLGAAELADHLALFRADSIVADCESIREQLGVDRWSLLGQSFGGFCALRYLSVAPHAVREAFFTGGLPPVGARVDDIYRRTWERMAERNARYHARYPGDRDRLRRLLELADAGGVTLPHGEPVSARRLRGLGGGLGMSDGAENLHYLLERDPGSPAFRHDLGPALFTGRSPLYLLHNEPGYAEQQAPRWAALRTMPDAFREDPTLLYGEHVFPWSFEDDAELAPWAEVADLLARREWPALYDADVLRTVDVPCAAAVYAEDPYVVRELSEETAALLPRMSTWVTADLDHNALRADGAAVLDRLFAMARARA